jgi:endonuclease-3 related protein
MHPSRRIYRVLLARYGPQGWWPLSGVRGPGSLPGGYHPGRYGLPGTRLGAWEVMLGAILTQNGTWTGAAAALANLYALGATSPQKLLALPDGLVKEAIRPARYMNQKARYLGEITRFFLSLGKNGIPTREALLAVTGVGFETADSILLYGFHRPEFVVDAYTTRLVTHLGLFPPGAKYMEIKAWFEAHLPREVPLYNEYHALIVRHAKDFYSRKPYGVGDPLAGKVREKG